ncbi:MAG: indolepyruvate ferredoxin oxidoreductase subunit alpha [Candidatus Methylomirabilales bacterium]
MRQVAQNIFIKVEVNDPKCLGVAACGECIRVCPVNIFEPRGDRIGIQEEDECTLCGLCLVCPTEAITIRKLYDEAEPILSRHPALKRT